MAIALVKNIVEAARLLRQGELVAYPTETAYGLGADALNPEAVAKVFAAKGRGTHKALPIIVDSIAMAKRYVIIDDRATTLAEQYWPGPLTLVLPLQKKYTRRLGDKGTVAIRVSGHATARKLSTLLGGPIVSTSANISGQGNSYSLRALKKSFGKSRETIYVLDGKTIERRKPTSLVRLVGNHIEVLRQGAIHL